VRAVIETSAGFLVYVAKEKSDALLRVATLSIPKLPYERWLAQQAEQWCKRSFSLIRFARKLQTTLHLTIKTENEPNHEKQILAC
jgi:hypothetical protein